MTGYVKFRRGIVEHLRDRRMTKDEFSAYALMILCADHRNGHWQGSGAALGSLMGLCARKGQYLVRALSEKGYVVLPPKLPSTGNYAIGINKFFNSGRTGMRPFVVEGARTCGLRAHGGAGVQEVKTLQEEQRQEAMPEKNIERLVERFFEAYPEHRRGDPRFLEIEWGRLPMIEMDIDAILAGLEAWKKSDEWQEAGGRYVPKAVNFLKELKWKYAPRAKEKTENEYEHQKRMGWR